MTIDYDEEPVTLGDGTVVSLRKPTYSRRRISPTARSTRRRRCRRASTPPMIGLGLVEQIHPADILAHADPDDARRRRHFRQGRRSCATRRPASSTLGRFGWKAQTPSIREQIGRAPLPAISASPRRTCRNPYGDCTEAQAACLAMPTGVQARLGDVEAPDPVLDLVTFYSQNLAVPARRDVGEPEVLHGKEAVLRRSAAPPATRRNSSPGATRPTRRRPSS